jgi:hypothetical protein
VSIDNIDLVGGTNGIFVETSANAGKLTIVKQRDQRQFAARNLSRWR